MCGAVASHDPRQHCSGNDTASCTQLQHVGCVRGVSRVAHRPCSHKHQLDRLEWPLTQWFVNRRDFSSATNSCWTKHLPTCLAGTGATGLMSYVLDNGEVVHALSCLCHCSIACQHSMSLSACQHAVYCVHAAFAFAGSKCTTTSVTLHMQIRVVCSYRVACSCCQAAATPTSSNNFKP